MTSLEFSNEFDIQYNNISSNASPGLDLYEKSIYLTKAQEEIIKNYYDPTSNKKQRGFENSEKRRHDLQALVKNYYSITGFKNINEAISPMSVFFETPSDLFLIVNEQVKVLKPNSCYYDKYIDVIPKTHDEYNIQIKNPFKKPDEQNIWRMDRSNVSGVPVVELITIYKHNELGYQMRYLKNPSPIILTNLDEEFPNDNLTINGISTETLCELHPMTQKEILDRAVELALGDYKSQNLEIKAQLNTRNE